MPSRVGTISAPLALPMRSIPLRREIPARPRPSPPGQRDAQCAAPSPGLRLPTRQTSRRGTFANTGPGEKPSNSNRVFSARLVRSASDGVSNRRSNADALGIELAPEHGYVKIDRRCRTSLPHVYAAGDLTGGYQFTHVASHEGRIAGANAAGKRARLDERVLPWVTFTDPEVAHVGLTEAQARERHRRVETHVFPMNRVDRARILERPLGFVKLVTAARPLLGRTGGGVLVGAQIVASTRGRADPGMRARDPHPLLRRPTGADDSRLPDDEPRRPAGRVADLPRRPDPGADGLARELRI